MTDERAIMINRFLLNMYMLREGLIEGPIPDLPTISKNEAIEACEVMQQHNLGTARNADGSTTITCSVAKKHVVPLLNWVEHQRISARLDRRL
jgi:hypothetical protein